MVKVIVPRPRVAGISRLGIAAARNSVSAMGTNTKKATNKLTPPYVMTAPAHTTATIACRAPNRSIAKAAMDNDGSCHAGS